MSDTPTDAAKEKPINDTGGGNAPAPSSQPTETQPTGTTTPSQESSSD
jgi:hypothetical protein